LPQNKSLNMCIYYFYIELDGAKDQLVYNVHGFNPTILNLANGLDSDIYI